MTAFDWVIIAIFLVSVIVGIMRGFLREALSIMSWVIAAWLAITFCGEAGDYIAQYVSLPAEFFRLAAGFGAIFIVTLFVFSLLSYAITKIFVHGPIKSTDRVLGILFGIIRGVAIITVIIILARGLGMSTATWWQKSQLVTYIEPVADYVEAILPEQLQGFRTQGDENDEGVSPDEKNAPQEAKPKSSSILDNVTGDSLQTTQKLLELSQKKLGATE